MQKLVLKSFLSPGDIVMLTAAVRDLHRAHPGQFCTDVRTSASELWEHNPYITPLDEQCSDVRAIDMQYPLIHRSNQSPHHFLHGYLQFLEEQLALRIPITDFKGDIHLSEQEKSWISQVEELGYGGPFWIVMAGGKYDFTAKWWNPRAYQEVVDHFAGRIQFVQCGNKDHWHPSLRGVMNLVGQTDVRQFVRLMYHAEGVLCQELRRHASKVERWIVLHDTTAFEYQGEYGQQGLWPAIEEFVAQGHFFIRERLTNQNGLTILERTPT